MTGHLLIKSKVKSQKSKFFDDRVNQYVHHIWKLRPNLTPSSSSYKGEGEIVFDKTLEFSDLRKFGKIVLVDSDKVAKIKEIKELGVDAMSPGFTFLKFSAILDKKKNRKVRDILMDQHLIAGIGNIYLSEILYEAGILPTREVDKISPSERKKLYNSIKNILKLAIKLRGTSDSDYRDTTGAPGNFQKVLRVYHRAGKECKKCGTMIKRLKMGQRSVFFCFKCQK